MNSVKQISLFKAKPKYRGRKSARILSLREYNHVILKSQFPILRKNHALIKELIRDTQLRFGMKLKAVAIMEDHIHFIAKIHSRKAFADSMRFLAGMIALKIRKKFSRNGIFAQAKNFWRQRIWSRIVRHGRDLKTALQYVWRNPFRARIFDSEDCVCIRDGVLLLELEWNVRSKNSPIQLRLFQT